MSITAWLDYWTTNSSIWYNNWEKANLVKLWKKSGCKTVLYNSKKLHINDFENKPDFIICNWWEISIFI